MKKVCIIGCGMVARAAHIPAYKYYQDEYEIVAVCDAFEEAAKSTAEEFEISSYYSNAEQMLKEQKPDVVSICVPNLLHKENIMLALQYGSNVICEKPLALNYQDAVEMFEFAKKQGVALMACQTLRFMPERKAAYKLVKNGEVGKVYSCEFSRVRSRGIPNWGKFHIKKYNGGGSFLDMGSHSIDSALWLIGNPTPVSVTAAMHTVHPDEIVDPKRAGAFMGGVSNKDFHPEDMDVESFASGSVTFDNGTVMLFKATWAANLKDENSISVAGEKLGFNTEKREIYRGGETYPMEVELCEFDKHPFFGHFQIVGNFARYLNGEEELIVKPEETINATAIMEAGYISASEGRTVFVSELQEKRYEYYS